MQLTTWRAAALVIGGATVIVACSSAGTIVESTGGFVGASSGASGTSASGPNASGSPPPRCPSDPPEPGGICSGSAPYCEYGVDLRVECAERYDCGPGSRWEETTGACAVRCPKTFAEIAPGTTCGDIDMACSYEEGTCGCVGERPPKDAGADADASDADAGDAAPPKVLYPGVWKCVAPPANVLCPSARPHSLSECVKSVTCDYGTCELGRPLVYDCVAGEWQESYDRPDCDR